MKEMEKFFDAFFTKFYAGFAAILLTTALLFAEEVVTTPVNQYGFGVLTGPAVLGPSGGHFATTSRDGRLRFWDLTTGEVEERFDSTIEYIGSMAFTPDGNFLITGNYNEPEAELWNSATGELLQTYTVDKSYDVINALAISPDGNSVLVGSYYKDIWLFDRDSAEVLRKYSGHQGAPNSVAFSPDGALVAAALQKWDDIYEGWIWDRETGDSVAVLTGHSGSLQAIAFSPVDTTVLTGSSDNTAILWNSRTGDSLRTFSGHEETVTSVAYSPDGKTILTASSDSRAILWDVETGDTIRSFNGHFSGIRSAEFTPDGNSVFTSSDDQSIRLWDVATGECTKIYEGHSGGVNSLDISPDGTGFICGTWDGAAHLWDISDNEKVRDYRGHEGSVVSLSYSPDGSSFASASYTEKVKVWNTATGENTLTINTHSGDSWISGDHFSVDWSPVGNSIISSSVTVSSSSANSFKPKLWDGEDGSLIRSFSGQTSWINGVAFSPDGKQIASASSDKSVKIYDTETGTALQTFAGDDSEVYAMAFSPEGNRIVTAMEDNIAKLWSVGSGECIHTFVNGDVIFAENVTSVAFAPNGRTALVAYGKEARLWDTQTGECVRIFSGQKGRVAAVSYSLDGKTVFTGSHDGTVLSWDISDIPVGIIASKSSSYSHDMSLTANRSGILTLMYKEAVNSPLSMKLYNAAGKLIHDHVIQISSKGSNSIKLEKPLARGVYLWKVETGNSDNRLLGKGKLVVR